MRDRGKRALFLLGLLLVGGCATAGGRGAQPATPRPSADAEALSLFGEPLFPPTLSIERRKELESRLAEARVQLQKHPEDPEAVIWLGRRTAYLGRYREAVAIYTEGITKHPENAKLYRHRGHRYITLRQFDAATADLEKASQLVTGLPDEIEPDGLPNERNIPTSTTNSNIWYHLGLAYYLKGDFEGALPAYRNCLEFSKNPDMLVATSHWLYMTLRRLGQEAEARAVLEPIREDMDIIENKDYHRLLLMYRGKLSPEKLLAETRRASSVGSATLGYGVGNWHLYNGRREEAIRIFQKVLKGDQWAAFGFIAAEADLKRLGAAISSK